MGKGRIHMSTIRLTAKLENLERLMAAISGFAGKQAFVEKRIREIELAVEEAFMNIFNHAYVEGKPGEVEVRYEMKDDATLSVEFLDKGIPFDMDSLPSPDLDAPISDRPIGGLGIHLIRKVADKVEYRREGEINRLTLLFRN
jgi:anti-sigma regulatory factor (Ser/Thr protein kinase)